MTAILTALQGAAGAGGGRRPLLPGRLDAPLLLTRAQVSARATAAGPDGMTWQEFGADAPRFHGAARWLLVEGQRTNAVTNPRGVGAVAGPVGSGGALPDGWAASGSPNVTILGSGVENGLPCTDLEIVSVSGAVAIELAPPVAASDGQVWTASFFARLLEPITGAGSVQVGIAYSGGGTTATQTSVTDTGTLQRCQHSATAPAGTTGARPRIRLSNGGMTVRVRLAAPQFEQAAFASSPILPAPGAVAASTRSADLAAAPLAALGIGPSGACTVLAAFQVDALPTTNAQIVLHLDNGSIADRFMLRLDPVGLRVYRRLAGGSESAATIGNPVAGQIVRVGLVLRGDGSVAACMDGGALQQRTGGPTGGLTHLRIGASPSGGEALFGRLGAVTVLPFALPDAALPGATTALPA